MEIKEEKQKKTGTVADVKT
jgi:hypothetical protein